MAVVQEHFMVGEIDFIKTYSDSGLYIYGGDPEGYYVEACDPASLGRTYTETHIPLEEIPEIADKAEAYDILMGVTE